MSSSAAIIALPALLLSGGVQASAPVFERRPEHCQAGLLVDISLPPGVELPELAKALAPLDIPAVILAKPPQLEGWPSEVQALEASGAELGLWLSQTKDAPSRPGSSPMASWARLRQERRDLRRATGHAPRAAGAAKISTALEGSLDIFGFTFLLPAPDGLLQAPRRTTDLQGIEGSSVVLWPVQVLEQDGALGPSGGLAALLDRTALALERGDHPVVRLHLTAGAILRDGPLLARWQAEVLAPCGASLLDRAQAEEAVLGWLRGRERAGGPSVAVAQAAQAEPNRTVSLAELSILADQLACDPAGGATLPRVAGEQLALDQAFLALALALSGRAPPLPLHPVLPPQSSPRSVLPPDGATLEIRTLQQALQPLLPGPGQQIPSFARVGEQALTSAELLCAMASAVAGDDPVRVTRTYSPDPFAPGLGWDGY